jgi:hypothetical protein
MAAVFGQACAIAGDHVRTPEALTSAAAKDLPRFLERARPLASLGDRVTYLVGLSVGRAFHRPRRKPARRLLTVAAEEHERPAPGRRPGVALTDCATGPHSLTDAFRHLRTIAAA